MKKVPLAIIESPYASYSSNKIDLHVAYARECMKDSLQHGEYPFASHLLYTQPGILDDKDPIERILGIKAGDAWMEHAAIIAVYTDLGITDGMKKRIAKAIHLGKKVEYRTLYLYQGD